MDTVAAPAASSGVDFSTPLTILYHDADLVAVYKPAGWLAVVQTPKLHIFIPLLGVVSGIALALYMTAHRLLPLGLFGLLSYVEPILLLLAAMLLGERIQPGQEVMYFLIAAAVVVMAFEGLMQLRNKPGAS